VRAAVRRSRATLEIAVVTRKIHDPDDERPAADARRRSPTDVDWESPRWRSGDDGQGETERGRRLRNVRAPDQPGAIDTRSIESSEDRPPDDGDRVDPVSDTGVAGERA
jgi:hypothetical protein